MAEFGKLIDFAKKNKTETILEWQKQVFNFLTEINSDNIFSKLELGETKIINIKGDDIFAIFQKYDSKEGVVPNFEAHKKFIDVQYVHKNSEYILVDNIDGAVCTQQYDEETDLVFYKLNTWSSLRLSEGDIAILYPQDLHAPCIMIDKPCLIEKVVVKISIDEK